MTGSEQLELLHDFLVEAGELLEGVDVKLVELEGRPDDKTLLNEIFRGFHTIKGGAGFLEVAALVDVCHRTETLFDSLRSGARRLSPAMLDVILAATAEVRRMFGELAERAAADPAGASTLEALDRWIAGEPELGVDEQLQAKILGRFVRSYDTGQRSLVGQRQRAVT